MPEYVENVTAAIVRATASTSVTDRTYNVGEPDALPEATWLRRVAAAVHVDITIQTVPDDQLNDRPPFNWAYSMAPDTRRLRTELDFAEPISQEEALSRTVAWEQA